jgi:hypothetical protein
MMVAPADSAFAIVFKDYRTEKAEKEREQAKQDILDGKPQRAPRPPRERKFNNNNNGTLQNYYRDRL